MKNNYIIRNEEKKDYEIVEKLIRKSFWNVYREGCLEHYVMHKLRSDKSFVKDLDFVLEVDNKIIAHISYAIGTINDSIPMLMFGPLSVDPEYQHQGYGSILVNYSLDKAKQMGYDGVCITGNPDYYHRFGFESASKYKIYYKGFEQNENCDFFMIKLFKPINYNGTYIDPQCFFPTDDEVKKFDEQFKEN